MNKNLYITQTENWINNFVIKHNLCPFAKQVMIKKQVRLVCSEAKQVENLLKTFITEVQFLSQIDAKEVDTSIIIHPFILEKFEDYLDFVALAEYSLEEMGMEGIVQLASFHPDYQFEGTTINAPENLTNRSPFPMLHLLREDSLTKVLKHYPNPEEIPTRNIAYLKNLMPNS